MSHAAADMARVFARRDLRGGYKHLRLLVACLILGVAAIAGVGTLSRSIVAGLESQGQSLLGGDLEVRLTHREVGAAERAHLNSLGDVSQTARMRAMVKGVASDERLLGELKAVDKSYPLYGTFKLAGGGDVQAALRGNGVVIDPTLADRVKVKVGDTLQIGDGIFTVRGLIAFEPDRASEGFALGPSAIIGFEALPSTQLVQPGSLIRYHYRIKTAATADLKAMSDALEAKFPEAGWRIQDRSNGAPGVRRFIDQLGQFLTLVGLTALLVSGLGVANAVTAYLERKTSTIATLKTLGATSGTIFRMYLWQIFWLSGVGIALGLLLGVATPWALSSLLATSLPVPPVYAFYWQPMLLAAAFGILVAIAAALWPLARARAVPAARLFRAKAMGVSGKVALRYVLLMSALLALILALAVVSSDQPDFAVAVVVASLLSLLILRGLGALIALAAAQMPRPRQPLLRLALANLHRPGSVTSTVVSALGLGLTLFAVLAVIESNLNSQIKRTLPERAPAFFFLDIGNDQVPAFTRAVESLPGTANLKLVPSLRGPVTRVKGIDSADYKPLNPGEAWILRGDRGLTYSAALPDGNELVAGNWWPADYQGPPLVSMEEEAARGLGLAIGDSITVSILGVEVEAKIANLRKVYWESLGFNFALVFAPGTLENAPHTFMATVEAEGEVEAILFKRITNEFPTVSAVRMKEVLTSVGDLLGKIGAAIRATGLVTVIAGVLVLIGAIAAGQAAKSYDAVILKVLGATRGQVMAAYLIEYALLGLVASVVAVGLGILGGWVVVTRVLNLEWALSWPPLLATVAGGMIVTISLGLIGTWAALRVRPNTVLRSE
jgi:putative ABC transport system permease protein